MSEHDHLSAWRLVPELKIVDAAILIAGGDPSEVDYESDGYYNSDGQLVQRTTEHPGFTPAFEALKSAIIRGDLPARLRYRSHRTEADEPFAGSPFWVIAPKVLEARIDPLNPENNALKGFDDVCIKSEPSWDASSVDVEDLRNWLKSRGNTSGFFFSVKVAVEPHDFMNPNHEQFAPELALAVKAWRAFSSITLQRGVLAALESWIEKHPEEWGPIKAISKEQKTRITTIVNWNKKGGASRTGD